MAHTGSVSATITEEQFAARELVRGWAASSGAITAVRNVEQGDPDAWRSAYDGLAQLGIFGVAVPEELGGAGGSVEDLCVMVDEAAAALVPGPVATTALATLVIDDEKILDALTSGQRTAGVALDSDITFDGTTATGTAKFVLGGLADGVLVLPVRGQDWIYVDATADGVTAEPLEATDFSRPLARVELSSAPATRIDLPHQRVADLTATVLAAEAAGLARWMLDTATEYAKVREQFGKPIGSFQAIKHKCADMLLQVEAATSATQHAAWAVDGDPDGRSSAARIAKLYATDAYFFAAAETIQILGGIGFTWEHPAHLYFKRAKSSELLFGDPTYHRELLAQRIGL
ncbi:MAG: acyl-CoA dehydrogenase [Mycobacterium sp.]|nr:acyl-CoA dehydrogenase [Mycobacterium sp.]